MARQRIYYLVNPSGTIHEVSKEHARQRLAKDPGYHMATAEEIETYRQAQSEAEEDGRRFIQRFDKPIGKEWQPDPDTAMAEAEEAMGEAIVDDVVDATRAAREMAEEFGVDLVGVKGTGLEGRVIEEDVARAIEAQVADPDDGDEEADGNEE